MSATAAGVRDAGEDYFLAGRAEVGDVGASRVVANVHGTAIYRVELTRRGGDLTYACTCPCFVREASICKHVWAVVLELEEAGELETLDDEAALRLGPAETEEGTEETAGGSAAAELEADSLHRPAFSEVENAGRGAKTGWRDLLSLVASPDGAEGRQERSELWARRELFYIVHAPETLRGNGLALTLALRDRKKDGSWGKVKQQRIATRDFAVVPDPLDRQILAVLAGGQGDAYGWYAYSRERELQPHHLLQGPLIDVVLPLAAESGRLQLLPRDGSQEPLRIAPDIDPPWEVALEVASVEETATATAGYRVRASLARGDERLSFSEVDLALEEGWCFTRERLLRLNPPQGFRWLAAFRHLPEVRVPEAEARGWLGAVVSQAYVPRLELPPELGITVVPGVPAPRFSVRSPLEPGLRNLAAELSFDYGSAVVPWGREGGEVFDPATLRMLQRDRQAERAARDRLTSLGVKPAPVAAGTPFELRVGERDLPRVARTLLAAGWWVEAEGRPLRRSGPFKMEVSSGLDWFDLSAEASFEGQVVALPEILAAMDRGEKWLRLGDGGFGLLPEDWLEQRGLLTQLGKKVGDSLRFDRVQAGLLDALVGDSPELEVDERFEAARRELAGFAGIEPAEPPAAFAGELREYQRQGLGWLRFLERFSFGGCLADDMGLGKTVQVLALLAGQAAGSGPCLVVAPRSVVFNWMEEAERFAPSLKALAHSGPGRARSAARLDGYDLVVTSYGLLREDVELFSAIDWNYLVLDEAQAIKNAGSQTAQVSRQVKARHRLALSGTPIENHLGELWSLFEFLNPGLLGRSAAFERASAKLDAPKVGSGERALLAQALRPFILRRTKAQVLPELPAKTEQTLHCELEPAERRHYDELKRYYQSSLWQAVEKVGWAKAKIHVLEALLRLRQAACHPGLIDSTRTHEPSAKLEALLPLLAEAMEGGHKVLVFSQFTSLLAILRARLDATGTDYLYLDGKTRDRQTLVSRFQTDPARKLFLISLRAGGLGLNLTAADYVFLLDPWWNPAVESQAIDRAHRIGQERHVFAYRLVAKDTVEEKILELQAAKRELADSILNEDNSLIRHLTREDLELLLG